MKKLLGIMVLGLLLVSCATEFNDFTTYEEFIREGKSRGYTYCSKAQKPWNILKTGKKYYRPMCAKSAQKDANEAALKECGINCVITMENFTLTPEGERLTKEANLKKKKEEEERKKKVAEKPKKKKTEPTEKKPGEVFSVASGTGFFINPAGYIVSNNHVIDSCAKVKVHYKGVATPVTILATDRTNDLALMKSQVKPDDVFAISTEDASLLDDVYVAGFPFGKMVSSSVKVTKGVVSALTGIANNYSNIQIDAALQPGNSGGPIINNKGNVIGVAVSKLDYKTVIKDFGAIPEGTNFGIKASTVQQFIKANNVTSAATNNRDMNSRVIGKKIQQATVYLDCWMTAQQINQFKTRKTFFTEFE